MNWKDIGIRALKTFVQAFIPVMIVALSTIDITDISASKSIIYSALISGASAGLSAVWNLLQQLFAKAEKDFDDEIVEDEENTNIEDYN